MDTVIGLAAGAILLVLGYSLKRSESHITKLKEFKKELHLYCSHIYTEHDEEDVWDYVLEPCPNQATVITSNGSMCEDHFALYIDSMSTNRSE